MKHSVQIKNVALPPEQRMCCESNARQLVYTISHWPLYRPPMSGHSHRPPDLQPHGKQTALCKASKHHTRAPLLHILWSRGLFRPTCQLAGPTAQKSDCRHRDASHKAQLRHGLAETQVIELSGLLLHLYGPQVYSRGTSERLWLSRVPDDAMYSRVGAVTYRSHSRAAPSLPGAPD